MGIPLFCSFFFAAPKKNEPKRRGLFPRPRGTKGQGTFNQTNPNGRRGWTSRNVFRYGQYIGTDFAECIPLWGNTLEWTSQNVFCYGQYIRMDFAERPLHGGKVSFVTGIY